MDMKELPVFDSKGSSAGSCKVPSAVFGQEDSFRAGLHQTVRWQRAKRRAGTHKVKTRSEVKATGKKPWRQKGLGRARAGSYASPIWVGGGVAHGPKVKSYEFRLNKKERRKALSSAISSRVSENKCFVVKDFGLERIRTKDAAWVLYAAGLEPGRKALVVICDEDQYAEKSLRNVRGIKVIKPDGLNVYDILAGDFLILSGKALERIVERLSVTTQ